MAGLLSALLLSVGLGSAIAPAPALPTISAPAPPSSLAESVAAPAVAAAAVRADTPTSGVLGADPHLAVPYFGARYYGAKTGRFTAIDPVYTWNENIVDPQRWNRYAHVRNNPLRYVDPDGRVIKLQDNASDTLKQQYKAAREYLGISGADFVLKELDARDEVVTILETTGFAEQDVKFDPDSNAIYWNPKAALRTTEGGSLSPASMLSHEADHALGWVKDPVAFGKRVGDKLRDFDNAEEQRVIRGSEASVAGRKHENDRNDHRGSYEPVGSARDRLEPQRQP